MMKSLSINDIDVTSGEIIYTCYGLGSCIGLFLTDRTMNVSGGAHIPLPKSTNSNLLSAGPMIEELMKRFAALGSNLTCLRAKFAGGARIYESTLDTGTQNVNVITEYLQKHRVYLAATDVGGSVSRTVRYNTATGILHIKTSDKKEYYL